MASPGTLHEWIEALPEEWRYVFARPSPLGRTRLATVPRYTEPRTARVSGRCFCQGPEPGSDGVPRGGHLVQFVRLFEAVPLRAACTGWWVGLVVEPREPAVRSVGEVVEHVPDAAVHVAGSKEIVRHA